MDIAALISIIGNTSFNQGRIDNNIIRHGICGSKDVNKTPGASILRYLDNANSRARALSGVLYGDRRRASKGDGKVLSVGCNIKEIGSGVVVVRCVVIGHCTCGAGTRISEAIRVSTVGAHIKRLNDILDAIYKMSMATIRGCHSPM